MSFLFFILLLAVLVFFFVLSAAGNILRAIFGLGGRKSEHSRQHNNRSTTIQQPQSKKSKIIDKSEGEYVDFEECD